MVDNARSNAIHHNDIGEWNHGDGLVDRPLLFLQGTSWLNDGSVMVKWWLGDGVMVVNFKNEGHVATAVTLTVGQHCRCPGLSQYDPVIYADFWLHHCGTINH